MNYAEVFTAADIGLVLGAGIGFLVGRYIWRLLDQVAFFKMKSEEPKPTLEKPTVTMGDYDAPRSIANTDADKTFGIIETKTPELLEWERQQEIEKQVLGR